MNIPTLLDRGPAGPAGTAPTGAAVTVPERKRTRERKSARILCRHCRHHVTDAVRACEVDGVHEHVLTNPVGIRFRVRAFDDAPGARAEGPLFRADTWFANCAWQLALCGGCGVHLGWSYEGRAFFWGLIADALLEQ